MATLFKQLEAGAVQCGLVDQSSRFLPESVVYEKVTKDNIVANLHVPFYEKILSQWSPWSLANSLADRIHTQARKVFAILALIGQEQMISGLIYNHNITDEDLPLFPGGPRAAALVSRIPKTPKGDISKEFTSFTSWDERRVRDFLEKQWLVLAGSILDVAGEHLELDPSCPLPIERSIVKVQARDVFVHQAWFHPECRLRSGDMEVNTGPSVAIKEIRNEKFFAREMENLEHIRDLGHPHLIKLLASYEKGSLRCFIFPWAEGGNLWQFWKKMDSSPRTSDFILWLLGQVFGLIDAIRVLHEKNIRHGDVKPQNILHFTDQPLGEKPSGRGTLVLADVGVSKSHGDKTTGLRHAATNTEEVTILYEAPEAEYDRINGQPRSRRYDMWSTGCMLLEFIVWLLYGFGAVEIFRSRRISSKDDPTTAPGNFFKQEGGQVKIHSMVKRAIKRLRSDPRCKEGTALAELLNLIEKRLLLIDPKKRAKAPELHDKLKEIVNKAREDPSYLWNGVDTPPEIPKFFVRSTSNGDRAQKIRKYSDSSEASSGSSGSASSGSSGSSGWAPHSTGGSSDSMDSLQSRDGV